MFTVWTSRNTSKTFNLMSSQTWKETRDQWRLFYARGRKAGASGRPVCTACPVRSPTDTQYDEVVSSSIYVILRFYQGVPQIFFPSAHASLSLQAPWEQQLWERAGQHGLKPVPPETATGN